MLQVRGQVDRGHPDLAQLTVDAVAAFKGCVQARDGIRHGPQDVEEVREGPGGRLSVSERCEARHVISGGGQGPGEVGQVLAGGCDLAPGAPGGEVDVTLVPLLLAR